MPKTRSWSDEQLIEAIAKHKSYRAVLIDLSLVPAGGNYDQLKRRVHALGLDTSHFTGKGWNIAWRFDPRRPVAPLSTLLVADKITQSYSLKKRLFKEKLKSPACELCGWCERSEDGRIPVELDHINGDKADNRIENLRVLCPNCHSLQPTHRGRNKKTRLVKIKV